MTTNNTEKTYTTEDLANLIGEKVTLVLVNTMGFPVSWMVKVQRAEIVKAERYQNHMTSKKCLLMQYVEKGKRKPRAYKFTEADLAIVMGWHDIKTPSSFMSFDKTLLDGMLAQVPAESIVYKQVGLV